jgi:hypothetical protein
MENSTSRDRNELDSIAKDMGMLLQSLDEIGAQVAAAHVSAGIESFCKQFEIERYISNLD